MRAAQTSALEHPQYFEPSSLKPYTCTLKPFNSLKHLSDRSCQSPKLLLSKPYTPRPRRRSVRSLSQVFSDRTGTPYYCSPQAGSSGVS